MNKYKYFLKNKKGTFFLAVIEEHNDFFIFDSFEQDEAKYGVKMPSSIIKKSIEMKIYYKLLKMDKTINEIYDKHQIKADTLTDNIAEPKQCRNIF